MTLALPDYPTLAVVALETEFDHPLGEIASPPSLLARLRLDADAPFAPSDNVKAEVRDLLRHKGYKPTGRGKPASEYLIKAAASGHLASINAAVDVCNVVSLHSGLPISVVDLDRTRPSLHVGVGGEDESYVFNASGQEIRLDGLLCLFDADGPCANPVRDSQRTKTHDGTLRTLSVIWAPESLAERLETAADWYLDLLADVGARARGVATEGGQ